MNSRTPDKMKARRKTEHMRSRRCAHEGRVWSWPAQPERSLPDTMSCTCTHLLRDTVHVRKHVYVLMRNVATCFEKTSDHRTPPHWTRHLPLNVGYQSLSARDSGFEYICAAALASHLPSTTCHISTRPAPIAHVTWSDFEPVLVLRDFGGLV